MDKLKLFFCRWWLSKQAQHYLASAHAETDKAKQAHADARHYLQKLAETQVKQRRL